MTEAEWLVCEDPTPMLAAIASVRTERKLRFLLTHGARGVWGKLVPQILREAIEVAERHVEGEASDEALAEAHGRAMLFPRGPTTSADMQWWQAERQAGGPAHQCVAIAATYRPPAMGWIENRIYWQGAVLALGEQMPKLFRELFGPLPFRPVTFAPGWWTDTALSLAQQMYDSRDFGAMPILGDALQDAGCDSEDILSHCRQVNGVHVRGCWVVDLVLGKQ